MNARDELVYELGDGDYETADRILAKHAHELAEKIRADDTTWPTYSDGRVAWLDAADLIDPEGNK